MNISIKDKKIYIYVIGVVIGSILYNYIDMDFSLYANKIVVIDFVTFFVFQIIEGIKFFLLVYFISFFDKRKIFLIIADFIFSLMIGGTITTFIKYGNSHIFASAIEYIFRILICEIVYKENRNIKKLLISLITIIVSALIQNFFIKIF